MLRKGKKYEDRREVRGKRQEARGRRQEAGGERARGREARVDSCIGGQVTMMCATNV
jgi:hypothetical protein